MRAGSPPTGPARRGGFTLLVMLGLLAMLGMGLSLAGANWRDQVQREREAEWLRVGDLYARAIERYEARSPGSLKRGPGELQELVLDTRFVGIERHMRSVYADPLQPSRAWRVLRNKEARIIGVYSDAPGEPFVFSPPPSSRLQLRPGAPGYARWAFVARPAQGASSSLIQ